MTHPYDIVRVACGKCGWQDKYRREQIIARYGKDAAMPHVLRDLADCARWSDASDPCGAYFPDAGSTHAEVINDAEIFMDSHAETFRRLGRT